MMNDKLFNIFNRKSFTSGKKSGGSAVVSVEVEARTPITKLLANLGDPVQDLHGYANPWPAGGGKNKLNPLATYKGVGYYTAVGNTLNPVAADKSWQDAGNDTFTISDLGNWEQACLISDPLPLGKAYVKISNVRGAVKCCVYVCNGEFKVNRISYARNPVQEGDTIEVNTTFTNDDTYFVVYFGGSGADASIQYPYAYSGDTAATDSFSPYYNICPISGLTGLSVYVSPTQNVADATTYTYDWTSQAGTVYGGSLDVVTGVLTSTMANIASYNGETITEPWLSSMDAYVSGATPTTGAQVVYTLATPVEYHVGRIPMYLMPGINYVWLSDGLLIDEFEYYEFPEGGVVCDAYIDGDSMQADGWFVKWRRLSAPQPKTDYTSVYGRDGSIDLTEESGDVFYEDRTVNLDMVYIGEDWNDAYSKLLNAIHGQKCAVQFTDDPYWYWAARLVASEFEHKTHSLTMNGVAFPYKLSIFENSYQASVNGAVEGTATELQLEGSRMRVSPQVVVTGEVTLKWGTKTATLSAGTYYVRGLKVGPEGVTLKVWGTGTVAITYREGSL